MFERDFYVRLINAEFSKQLKTPMNEVTLNIKEPRILEANPLKSGKFGHYRPARYFSENVATLWAEVSDTTKDRFEATFKHFNTLL